MKRLANIILILAVLIVSVQPKLALHFCGNNFIGLHINKDASQIKSACFKDNEQCLNKAYPKDNTIKKPDGCQQRNIVVVDIDSDNYALSGHDLNQPAYNFITYLCDDVRQYNIANGYLHLFSGKSPPSNLCLPTGRDIQIRNCAFLI